MSVQISARRLVAEGMEHLREKNLPVMPDVQHDALENFLLYFDKTYVWGVFCRVNGNEGAVRLRRLPFQFPPSSEMFMSQL